MEVISLNEIREGLYLNLGYKENTFEKISQEDVEQNLYEAKYQLKEGQFYDYEFSDSSYFFDKSVVSFPSELGKHRGQIRTNIYVGRLRLFILKKGGEDREDIDVGYLEFEVQSVKTSYREDYRFMLEEITEYTANLLLQSSGVSEHHFMPDYEKNEQTLYQRFVFLKSMLQTDEFQEAIQRIMYVPVTHWAEREEAIDVRRVKRWKQKELRQCLHGSNREKLPQSHYLYQQGVHSISTMITSSTKKENLDTNENRFVKHVLESFLVQCLAIKKAKENHLTKEKFDKDTLLKEVNHLILDLEEYLEHSFFRKLSKPNILNLNSPVLQRKEGYREVLRVWLMFEVATKLIWKGGEDVYRAGKRDVATLYEYWLFFTLVKLISEVFEFKDMNLEHLFQKTKDGLDLQLKQGKSVVAFKDVYKNNVKNLHVKFTYNRTFEKSSYKQSGSWSVAMRPDYTLSLWPEYLTEEKAEEQEEMVHIHFDAKYKVENMKYLLDDDFNEEELSKEKQEQYKGKYKRMDLLKMHAYKDAIRRTAGAYILYPGKQEETLKGFHEILPGLGAFAIRPHRDNNGSSHLKSFLNDIVEHVLNRASQREYLTQKAYYIYQKEPQIIKESLPKNMILQDTLVLIGYCKNETHKKWIENKSYYNVRASKGRRGYVPLNSKLLTAKYLLLYNQNNDVLGFYKIEESLEVFSEAEMLKAGYKNPKGNYFMLSLENPEEAFSNKVWDIHRILKKNPNKNEASKAPFALPLIDLFLP